MLGHSLKFSTNPDPVKSKTKCIVFSKSKPADLAPIMLNGDPLPWVRQHHDCVLKRGKFIGKLNSLLQEFHFVKSSVFMKLLNIYASSFYGSNLWDLYSSEVDRIYKSWNVTVRNVFNLPWTTHRYWIETVSACPHPKTFLSSRFVKFAQSLTSSKKSSVRYLSSLFKEDYRTLFGRTLGKIAAECGVSPPDLSPRTVQRNLLYFPVPDDQQWRVPLLFELLDARSKLLTIENLTSDQIFTLIDSICTS